MEKNMYQAPESQLDDKNLIPPSSEKGSPIKAILIATGVDIGGSIAVGVVLGIVYGVMLAMEGVPIEQIEQQMQTVEFGSTISLIGMGIGAFISIFAGYLCAKTVNHSEYKVVAALCLVVSSIGALMNFSYYSTTELLILTGITVVCVFFGAWLFVRTKSRTETVSEAD